MDKQEQEALLHKPDYRPGDLEILGGGYVDWWHSYIKSEVGKCNAYWREIVKQGVKP